MSRVSDQGVCVLGGKCPGVSVQGVLSCHRNSYQIHLDATVIGQGFVNTLDFLGVS